MHVYDRIENMLFNVEKSCFSIVNIFYQNVKKEHLPLKYAH